ncbi:MAG: OmpA family protein [Gemmatimonadetes bacterium]|nr:OmpA family protein [Gemmatimonadota bacterium]
MHRLVTRVSLAALCAVTPLAAQERGTVEFGAFGSAGSFNAATTLDRAYGGGGRVGIFLDPRVSIEFEKGEMSSTRTQGLTDVNVGLLSAHLVWAPIVAGPLSLHLGGGAGGGTETNFLHTYGVNALVGARLALSNTVSLRADVVADWMANYNWSPFQRLLVGLSFYRHPNVATTSPGPVPPRALARVDTVMRTRVDTVVRTTRDTLRVAEAQPDQLVLRVQFATDSTSLLPKSLPVLDTIAMAIIATPGSRWEISGHTDSVGTTAANKALGQARAQSVLDYLVTKGVPRANLMANGYGEERPVFSNETLYGRAQNRRVQLRRIPPPPTGKAVP